MPAQGGIAPGTSQRAASRASNVRYEDGVVCNAPGYEKVKLDSTTLSGLVAQWNLNEASGSRIDASGNGHILLESGSVGSEAGLFGVAAVFTTPPFTPSLQDTFTVDSSLSSGSFVSPFGKRVHDFLSLDSALSEGFYNPKVQELHDSSRLDLALDSGIYLATVTIVSSQDSALLDSTMLSGAYTLTVLTQDTQDSALLDSTLLSGTYTLSVIVPEVPEDRAILDAALDSGFVGNIADPETHTDRLSLTASLESGSYS
jgi:hypothetical protein